MKKIKKHDWRLANEILEMLLNNLQERGHLGDEEYGRLLLNATGALEEATEYSFKKSLKKKELKEYYGENSI